MMANNIVIKIDIIALSIDDHYYHGYFTVNNYQT